MNNELNLIANVLQILNTILLLQDASNNDLMKELQNQNTKYFEEIIKMLKEINEKLSSSLN